MGLSNFLPGGEGGGGNIGERGILWAGANQRIMWGRAGVGIFNATPSAKLHIAAGSSSAGTAPLKIDSGPLMTTPEVGTLEFLTDDLWYTTTTGPTRKALAVNPTWVNMSDFRAFNTTYTNTGNRSKLVMASARCMGGNLVNSAAYMQARSDTASPPTTLASGLVGFRVALANEDNDFQVVFVVAPGHNYRLDSVASGSGSIALQTWMEATF